MSTSFTYVLENSAHQLYIGMTYDPVTRREQHRKGECPSSRNASCGSYDFLALYGFLDRTDSHRFECFLQELSEPALRAYLKANTYENLQVMTDIGNYLFKHERQAGHKL